MIEIKYKNFLNLQKSFEPDYQLENPVGFASAFKAYMNTHFDYDKHPERYLSVAKDAYRWANKSILYDKLGVQYEDNPAIMHEDLFKSKFMEIASHDEDLLVKGGEIFMGEPLQKSLANSSESLNEKFEDLWLKTFNTF